MNSTLARYLLYVNIVHEGVTAMGLDSGTECSDSFAVLFSDSL